MRRLWVLEVVLNGWSRFRVFDDWNEWQQACREARDWDIRSFAWEATGRMKDEKYNWPNQ